MTDPVIARSRRRCGKPETWGIWVASLALAMTVEAAPFYPSSLRGGAADAASQKRGESGLLRYARNDGGGSTLLPIVIARRRQPTRQTRNVRTGLLRWRSQ